MKAAHHGSPPLARPNRHQGSSSYDRMKNYPRSDSHNPKMPPFLRLDSAGEVTSLDGSHNESVGHRRTNSCRRQGPETSAGVSPGKNGLFGKLMSHFVSQPTSSALLESSRTQDSFSLDDLLNSKQAFSSVSMPVNPSHVKMAQINCSVPHVPNRYGKWRSMSRCPNYYPFLPKGVFPCHMFQDLHAQRIRRHGWPTSGQFVIQNRMASLACSFFDAWTFSPGSSNSSLRTESDSESSTSTENLASRSEKVSATQSESRTTVCDSSQRSENMDPSVGTVTVTVQTSAQKKCLIPSDSTDDSSKYCNTLFSVKSRPTASTCLNLKYKLQTSSPDSHRDSGRETGQPQRRDLQSSTTNHRKKQEDQFQATSGKADVQPSPPDLEEEWEEIEEPGNGTLDAESEAESEKEWACFMNCQFSLTNLLSTPAKKGPACKKGKEEESEGKRRAPKPCPAVTARWRQVYCADLPPERSCKVRFECGKDKDTVFEFVKGEDEFLTVMEMQKAYDQMKKHEKNNGKLLRQGSVDDDDDDDDDAGDGSDLGGIEQHKQNAAKLPQQKSINNEDDGDDIDGDASELGAVGGPEATPKKQADNDNAHMLVVGGRDSSSEEEEDPQGGNNAESDSDDDDDDDDIVFEDEDGEQNGIIVEEDGNEQDDNESDSEDEDGEQNHYFIAVELSDSDEDSDDDVVFEHEDNSQIDHSS